MFMSEMVEDIKKYKKENKNTVIILQPIEKY